MIFRAVDVPIKATKVRNWKIKVDDIYRKGL